MSIKSFILSTVLTIAIPAIACASQPYMPHTPDFMKEGTPTLDPPEWHAVSVTGKLRTDFLPVRPTVRIYMICDSLIRATVSVPLLGEMARMEATPNTVRLLNKSKRVYFEQDLTGVTSAFGNNVTLANLQDLLLGRPFKPGLRTLALETSELEYDTGRDAWLLRGIYPEAGVQTAQVIDTAGQLLYALCARFKSNMNASGAAPTHTATLAYVYSGSKTTLSLRLVTGHDREIEASYEYNAPDMSPRPIEPMNIDSRWRRAGSLKDFIKSF